AAAVGEDDLQQLLATGSESERDERIIADCGRHREPIHPLGAVEHVDALQEERFGLLDESSVAERQARAIRMADRQLNVDQFIAADSPFSNELGNVNP